MRARLGSVWIEKSKSARPRPRRAEIPLYHTLHKKSIGKMHKIFGFWHPGIVHYDEMKKVCDFVLTKCTQCAIIYNVRRGYERLTPSKKNKKSFKNPLTNSTKCDIIKMSIRERHKTSPTDKKNKKSFDKPLDKRHKMCYNIRAVGKKPTD